jgi:hypothetical protein
MPRAPPRSAAGCRPADSGWWCRGCVSATSYTVIGVVNKALTLSPLLAIETPRNRFWGPRNILDYKSLGS